MSKIIFISDLHLTHYYHKDYDRISDLHRLFKDYLMPLKPDAIICLGDFFDYRQRLKGAPITMGKGLETQSQVVRILNQYPVPFYCIKGNHDDIRILQSFDTLLDDFHWISTPFDSREPKPIEIEKGWYWFAEISYDEIPSKIEEKLHIYMNQATKFDSKGSPKILLLHINMTLPDSPGIDKVLLQALSDSFDFVINGHEHKYRNSVSTLTSIKILPAIFPWWIAKGAAPIQKYKFKKNKLEVYKKNKIAAPFGYLVFDSNKKEFSKHSFYPSVVQVEVEYELNHTKNYEVIQQDWESILKNTSNEIFSHEDFKKLLYMPIFTGDASHLILPRVQSILEQFSLEFPKIDITDYRTSDTLESNAINATFVDENDVITWKDVNQKALSNISEIHKDLEEKGIQISKDNLKQLVNNLNQLQEEYFINKKSMNHNQYLASHLNIIKDILFDIFTLDPKIKDNFTSKLTVLLEQGGN